MIVVTEAKMKL